MSGLLLSFLMTVRLGFSFLRQAILVLAAIRLSRYKNRQALCFIEETCLNR